MESNEQVKKKRGRIRKSIHIRVNPFLYFLIKDKAEKLGFRNAVSFGEYLLRKAVDENIISLLEIGDAMKGDRNGQKALADDVQPAHAANSQ